MIDYLRCSGLQQPGAAQAEFTDKPQQRAGGGQGPGDGLRELWATAYEQNVMVPLYGLNFIHGQTPKLKWGPPRADLIRAMNEWTLED